MKESCDTHIFGGGQYAFKKIFEKHKKLFGK